MGFKVKDSYKESLKKFLNGKLANKEYKEELTKILDYINLGNYQEAYDLSYKVNDVVTRVLMLVLFNVDPDFLKKFKEIPIYFLFCANLICESFPSEIFIPKEVSSVGVAAFMDSGVDRFIIEDPNLIIKGNIKDDSFGWNPEFVIDSSDESLLKAMISSLNDIYSFYFKIYNDQGKLLYESPQE